MRRIASKYIDPASLQAYVACRLIPLDKWPGVRPIGIGEVVRRIIGRAILTVTSKTIEQAAGSLQLCAGQDCGIEGAIHAMYQVYQRDCHTYADLPHLYIVTIPIDSTH